MGFSGYSSVHARSACAGLVLTLAPLLPPLARMGATVMPRRLAVGAELAGTKVHSFIPRGRMWDESAPS